MYVQMEAIRSKCTSKLMARCWRNQKSFDEERPSGSASPRTWQRCWRINNLTQQSIYWLVVGRKIKFCFLSLWPNLSVIRQEGILLLPQWKKKSEIPSNYAPKGNHQNWMFKVKNKGWGKMRYPCDTGCLRDPSCRERAGSPRRKIRLWSWISLTASAGKCKPHCNCVFLIWETLFVSSSEESWKGKWVKTAWEG